MITITIVRHGESTDNNRLVWAGHSDAPLSVLGMKQAEAVGKYLKDTKFDAIIASDLKRALWTAEQIQQYQPEPKVKMVVDEQLREQHFGIAEGKPYGEGPGKYPRIKDRSKKYDRGESQNDVRARANRVIAQYIEESIRDHQDQSPKSKHIAVVAHGIFNSEFLGALIARLKGKRQIGWIYTGMGNASFTRVEVGYATENPPAPDSPVKPEVAIGPKSPENAGPHTAPASPPQVIPVDESLPGLAIRVTHNNFDEHTDHLRRQPGGIGSMAYDANQQDIRAFFGGASKV